MKPSITDLTYNLGKDFRVNAVNESEGETVPGSARVLKLRYNLKSHFENADKSVKLWELAMLGELQSLANKADEHGCVQFDGSERLLTMSFAASQSLDLEMAANIGSLA